MPSGGVGNVCTNSMGGKEEGCRMEKKEDHEDKINEGKDHTNFTIFIKDFINWETMKTLDPRRISL